jgi:hypothetical protein
MILRLTFRLFTSFSVCLQYVTFLVIVFLAGARVSDVVSPTSS